MILRHLFKGAPLLLLAAALAGCVKEDIPTALCGPEADGSVTITVNIPGQQIPSVPSRSIAGDGGEAAVKTIDVLVFKSGGSGEVLAGHARGVIAGQSGQEVEDYRVRFTAQLKTEPAATTVAILANVPAAAVAAATALYDKEDILETLVYASSNAGGLPEGWKWNAVSSSNYTPIPMYGEYDVTRNGQNTEGIKNGMKMDGIDLVRMLARVDVFNSAPGFTMSGVYVANYNTAGYIAPAWGPGGMMKTSLPLQPMIPAAAGSRKGEADAMYYPGAGFEGDIYIYEAGANPGGEYHAEAPCLIVKGRRAGDEKDTFYRIDFTYGTDAAGNTGGVDGFDPTTTGFMPVYRNHRYSFGIESVAGPGYADLGEALSMPGIMNNFKCSLLVVDEKGVTNMVFDGEHYLGVGRPALLDASGTPAEIIVSTNHSAGWNVEKITWHGAQEGWLTAAKEDSGNIKTANLRLSALPNDSGEQRTATVVLSAGRLRYELETTQDYERMSIRIFEYADGQKGDEISLVEFDAAGTAQAKSFMVEWYPADAALRVTASVETNYQSPFVYSSSSDLIKSETCSDPSGTRIYTIQPGALAANPDPLYEQGLRAQFSVTADGKTLSAGLDIRHHKCNAVVDKQQVYLLDGSSSHSFTVRSNVEWTAYYVNQEVAEGVGKQFITSIGGIPVSMDETSSPVIVGSGGHNLAEGGTRIEFSVIDEIQRYPEAETYTGNGYILVVAAYNESGNRNFENRIDELFCIAPATVGESNCYMMQSDRRVPLKIPLSQLKYTMKEHNTSGGNLGILGRNWIADYDRLRVQVLWSDVNEFGTDDAVVKFVMYNNGAWGNESLDDGWIIVMPGRATGNAGIILYEENDGVEGYKYNGTDKIRWSWHIWRSDYFPYRTGSYPGKDPVAEASGIDGAWMDRNLGALSNAIDDPQTLGLMYQWGRKDPFPGAASTSASITKPFYYAPGTGTSFLETQHQVTDNFVNAFLNPATRYRYSSVNQKYDWITHDYYQNDNLWGQNTALFLHTSGKSVYDPCPEGYRVPKKSEWTTSEWVISGYTHGQYNVDYDSYFPTAGKYYGLNAGIKEVGSNGSYWTASPSGVYSHAMTIPNDSQVKSDANSLRANSSSVRCRAEAE